MGYTYNRSSEPGGVSWLWLDRDFRCRESKLCLLFPFNLMFLSPSLPPQSLSTTSFPFHILLFLSSSLILLYFSSLLILILLSSSLFLFYLSSLLYAHLPVFFLNPLLPLFSFIWSSSPLLP